MNTRFSFSLSLLLVFLLISPAYPQVSLKTGSIYGRVLDDQQRPLPGVVVTLEADGMSPRVGVTANGGSFRFSNLPPGFYSVTYAIEGYTQITQDQIEVRTGVDTELEMKLSAMDGGVTEVKADSTIGRKTQIIESYGAQELRDVPNSRDPWSLADQTPSIDVDRYSVSGSEAGQQAGFVARGASDDTTVWNVEGVNVTDPGALGAAPTYFDFESFQELSISTGGNDASVQTGGVVVNIVTKRAGNRWEGNGSMYFTNDSLQGTNTPEELKAKGQEKSNRIDEIKDYGFDAGGPLIPDKLFVWGAYHKNDIGLFTVTGLSDFTELTDYNLKANYNWNPANESQFSYFDGEKVKHGRGFNPFIQAPETLWDQAGTDTILPGIWTGQHTWIPNDHAMITARYGYIGLGFSLVPAGGNTVPMILLAAIPRYEDTGYFTDPIDRPAHDFVLDADLFRESWAGGDHEFKFGFEYKTSKLHTFSSYGNGTLVVDYYQTTPGGPLTSGYVYAQHFIDGRVQMDRSSVYATDVYRRDRLTLNLGLRFDRQTGRNLASTIPAVPGYEQFIGSVNYTGADPGITFNDWSPRLGISYDLTGDGRTVARANYARYYDAYSSGYLTHSNPTFTYNGAIFSYTNANGDRTVTPDEITGGPLYYGGLSSPTFNIDDFLAKHLYSKSPQNSSANEFLVGIERQIDEDVVAAATFTHRTYQDFLSILPYGIASTDFVAGGTYTASTVLGNFNVPYFTLPFEQDGTVILRNIDGYQQTYNGLDLSLRKRMSHSFMASGAVTLQRQKAHYDNADGAAFTIGDGGITGSPFPFDPGMLQFLNDQPYAYAPGGSGKAGVYPYSEWQIKMSGVYQLPKDISIGAFARYQQGYPYVLFGTLSDGSLSSALSTSRHLILLEPFGSRRFDNIFTLDLQFEKSFDFASAGRLSLSANLFNVTNTNTVIRRNRSVNSLSLNSIEENISPRALRIGARYSF